MQRMEMPSRALDAAQALTSPQHLAFYPVNVAAGQNRLQKRRPPRPQASTPLQSPILAKRTRAGICFLGECLQIIDADPIDTAPIIGPACSPEGFLGESAERRFAKLLHVFNIVSMHTKYGFKRSLAAV